MISLQYISLAYHKSLKNQRLGFDLTSKTCYIYRRTLLPV